MFVELIYLVLCKLSLPLIFEIHPIISTSSQIFSSNVSLCSFLHQAQSDIGRVYLFCDTGFIPKHLKHRWKLFGAYLMTPFILVTDGKHERLQLLSHQSKGRYTAVQGRLFLRTDESLRHVDVYKGQSEFPFCWYHFRFVFSFARSVIDSKRGWTKWWIQIKATQLTCWLPVISSAFIVFTFPA